MSALLACYQARLVKSLCAAGAAAMLAASVRGRDCGGTKNTSFFVLQPKFKRVVGLFVNNQFGPGEVDATNEDEFCVPSEMSRSHNGKPVAAAGPDQTVEVEDTVALDGRA